MNVKDLRANGKVDSMELTLTDKNQPREFTSRWGSSGRVCDAQGTDPKGDTVVITLWNEEIDRFAVNDRIRITNGYVKEFRGELQVSAGKYGKLEKL